MTIIKVSDITVEVERKWIRNMHLKICLPDARIRVSAPMWVSERAIRQFVLSKEEWIKKRMAMVAGQKGPAAHEYVSGEVHCYKGHRYRLQVVCHDGRAGVRIVGDDMVLHVREGATREQRERVMREWYRAELKAMLPALIEKWEGIIGVKANKVTIKQMKTIWGSCNHRTHNINFNLELMKRPVHCIEYVVVHELLHIIVRLHNEEFKALLTRYLPNWRRTREELNRFVV